MRFLPERNTTCMRWWFLYSDPVAIIADFLEAQFQIGLDREAAVFVPLLEHGVYLRLVEIVLQEMRQVQDDASQADVLLLDAWTLKHLRREQVPLPDAGYVGCLPPQAEKPESCTQDGCGPDGQEVFQTVSGRPIQQVQKTLSPTMRMLLILSRPYSLLLIGEVMDRLESMPVECTFHGAWTAERSAVLQVARALPELKSPVAWTADRAPLIVDSAPATSSTRLPLRLMQVQATAQLQRQHAIANENADIFYVLNALYTISPYDKVHDVLFKFVQQVAKVVVADRCSVVQITPPETSEGAGDVPPEAYVLASHEDIYCDSLPLELAKYPELRQALRQQKRVCLNPVPEYGIFAEQTHGAAYAPFTAMLVLPMLLEDADTGNLFLRVARRHGAFEAREIRFLEVLAVAAGNALAHAQLFRSMQQTNLHLEHLSRTDGLTRLYNYRYLLEHFEEELQRAQRYRLPLSFLLFDIDDFKQFNDRFGHLFGDEVLRELARRMRQAIRNSDCIARYGGEEFAIILPHTHVAGAMKQAERLRRQVTDTPFRIHGESFTISISIGVSGAPQGAATSCAAIIEQADEALYKAKSAGKNRVCGPRSIESS